MADEPTLLEDFVLIGDIPCRIWAHQDDNSVFTTLRSPQHFPYAAQLGFEPYYKNPDIPVYYYLSSCPDCGATLAADLAPSIPDTKYVLFCPCCGKTITARKHISENEIKILKTERKSIPDPGPKTVLMQILGDNREDAQKRLNYLINPASKFGLPEWVKTNGLVFDDATCREQLFGAQDYYDMWNSLFTPGFLRTHENAPGNSIFIIRFKTSDVEKLIIPYSIRFGGEFEDNAGYDGSGFARPNGNSMIPVWQSTDWIKITGGMVIRIDPDGREYNIANFNFFTKR